MTKVELVQRVADAIIVSGGTMGFVYMGFAIVSCVQDRMRRRRDRRAYKDFLARDKTEPGIHNNVMLGGWHDGIPIHGGWLDEVKKASEKEHSQRIIDELNGPMGRIIK